jgi:hypothetical protein
VLTTLAEGPGYFFALWKNLYILDFRSTPTVEGLRATVGAKKVAVAQSPAGLAVLNFLAPGPLPSTEVRHVAQEVQTADTAGTLCHATVVEATGFAGSAMRSVLTALRAFDRSPFPRKVFGDVDESLSWMVQQSQQSAEWVIGAKQAVAELRKRRGAS